MNTQPITPQQAEEYKTQPVPEEVIRAFNTMIQFNWTRTEARFTHKEVIKLIQYNRLDIPVIDNKWLNVKTLFEDAGWKVQEIHPWDEDSYFIFTKEHNDRTDYQNSSAGS